MVWANERGLATEPEPSEPEIKTPEETPAEDPLEQTIRAENPLADPKEGNVGIYPAVKERSVEKSAQPESPQKPPQPADLEKLPVAGAPRQLEAQIANVRAETKAAAEKENIDFSKATNLAQLEEMLRQKRQIINSHGEVFTAETIIKFIKDGQLGFVTNKDGLRDAAEKLIATEKYFTEVGSLDELYKQIEKYYADGGIIKTSRGEAYGSADELKANIKAGRWGMVTGNMGIRDTAMRLTSEKIKGDGTERKKPGFFGRLFGK